MHGADIILIWNSFLSAAAGTTPAWRHPKSITLLGLLASVWRGTERRSVQVPSQTFNLKDNVVFRFEGHVWYWSDAVFYGWGDCRITPKHSRIQITRRESRGSDFVMSVRLERRQRVNAKSDFCTPKLPSPSTLPPPPKHCKEKGLSPLRRKHQPLSGNRACHTASRQHIYIRVTPVLNKHPQRCFAIHLQELLVMDPLWKAPNAPGCNDTGSACCKTVAYG